MRALSQIWEDFLKIVHEEYGSRIVETWFKAVSLARWDAATQTVHLEVPNVFVKNWIYSHYHGLIQEHMGRLLHVQMPTVFLYEMTETTTHGALVPEAMTVSAPLDVRLKKSVVRTLSPKKGQAPHSFYTFDTFVVGPNSSLSYAAAQAVAQKPGVLYNPLFIYGGSGLGKTHLLRAIGNHIAQRSKSCRVLYQTADRFVSEFIAAIRFDKVHLFKEKYHEIDVLLIDDIQFISHKEQTQEAFFHIFNSLYDASKQLVFSSDVFPHNIEGIAQRLSSRLVAGLITDIAVPSLEIKIAIIKKKAALHKIDLDDDSAHLIASCARENIRELEGILIRIIAFASLTQQPISMDIIQKVVTYDGFCKKKRLDCEQILAGVMRHFSCSKEDLLARSRSKELTVVRQIAIFLMKKLTDKSLRSIGHFFGGRDHSTVLHALERIEQELVLKPELHAKIRLVEQEIVE